MGIRIIALHLVVIGMANLLWANRCLSSELSSKDAQFLCESIVVFDKLGADILSYDPPTISVEEPSAMLAKAEKYLRAQVISYRNIQSNARELKQVLKDELIVRHLTNLDKGLTKLTLTVNRVIEVMEKIDGSVEKLVAFQDEIGRAFATTEMVFADISSKSLASRIREKQWSIASNYVTGN